MKGAWILPTRHRPALLKRFLAAAVANSMSTPGIILSREPELDLPADLVLPEGWTVRRTETESMGDKFREVWPVIRDMDWVGGVVDDVVPETPGWDRTLISGLNGANVISCNDGARAPFRMCAPVFSGGWLRALGYLYAEGFTHTYWDDALERLGRATDTWWVCMDVVLRHLDAFQSGVADDTHTKSYGRTTEDRMALHAWRRHEMDGAVRRIMDLKAQKREPERKVANA